MDLKRISTHGLDIFKMQSKEKERQLQQTLFTMVSAELKKLCDKVTRCNMTVVKAVDYRVEELVDSTDVKLEVKASVEVFDEGVKTLEVPVLGTLNTHGLITLNFPEVQILEEKIKKTSLNTSKQEAHMEKVKAKVVGISEFKKAEVETYWNKVNRGSVDSNAAERVTGDPGDSATTLTLVKTSYPESFQVGQIIPLGGVDYKITAENGGEWVLNKVELTSEQEEKKESLEVEKKAEEEKKEEVKVEEQPVEEVKPADPVVPAEQPASEVK